MAYGSEDYWMSSSRLMAALMTDIKDAIIEGSGLFEKLDAIDGGLDGIITLADLNSGECDLLAAMLGVETSVEDGGDLLNKLDALDGTMDGKLTLAELNVSSVKTNLDTAITRLDTSITKFTDMLTKLDSTITKLTGIKTNTDGIPYMGWSKIGTACTRIYVYGAGTYSYTIQAHHNNPSYIRVWRGANCIDNYRVQLQPGESYGETGIQNDLRTDAVVANQYYRLTIY